ncbi:MAG TPA: hypothetical protein VIT42_05060 [Microlunatus sp.]
MEKTVTYRAEVEDPVTGEALVFEAESEAELDQLIDRQFGFGAADQKTARPNVPSA